MPFSSTAPVLYDPDLNFQRPELIEFLAYWNAKRGARPFPSRADIVPREISRLLPWIHMYDVIADGTDFRVRLAGTALSAAFGNEDIRGRSITTLPAQVFTRLRQHLNRVMEVRTPVRTRSDSTTLPGHEFQGSEGCLAPLSSDTVNIDLIIAAVMLDTRR